LRQFILSRAIFGLPYSALDEAIPSIRASLAGTIAAGLLMFEKFLSAKCKYKIAEGFEGD
jgi:hypothetical protein